MRRFIGWVRFQYQARVRNAWYARCWRCVINPWHGPGDSLAWRPEDDDA